MEFYPEDPRYALQTFSRQSSDYLRHSVLSPKRFGQKEMKIEQKARHLPKKSPFFLGGVLNRIQGKYSKLTSPPKSRAISGVLRTGLGF